MLPFENSAMVWGIVGSLGSGKSLVGVANIVKNLRIGSCMIVTNIRLNTDLLSKHLGLDISPFYQTINLFDDDFNFNTIPWGSHRGQVQKKRVLVVLDEVAEFFDQYQKANAGKLKRFLSWLRHSSKRGQDVLLICQHPKFMQVGLRNLIHRWVFCVNLSQYKIPIVLIPLFPGFSATKIVDKYQSVVRGGFWLYSQSKWGQYYDTSQIIQEEEVEETSFEEYKPPFDWELFLIRIAFLLLLVKIIVLFVLI